LSTAETKRQQTDGPPDNRFSVNLPSAATERSGYVPGAGVRSQQRPPARHWTAVDSN